MRACFVIIICVLVGSQLFGGESDVCRVAVYAEAEIDKTEGGELVRLIADELRRKKDVVIDNKSPYLIVSCGVMIHAHGERLLASVAFMLTNSQLLEHFPLTADSLQDLAHQVVLEFDKRELNDCRQRHTNQLHERPNQSPQPTAGPSDE